MNRWRRVTQRDTWADPVSPDAIEYVLTPRERDLAAIASVHLEANRRRLNARDEAREFITPFIQRPAREGSDV